MVVASGSLCSAQGRVIGAPVRARCEERLDPGITFDFGLTPRRVDLVSEPFDVVIRMGESGNSQRIARALALLTPHPATWNGRASQTSPATWIGTSGHECLSLLKAGSWTLRDGKRSATVSVGGRFVFNSVGLSRRLATLDMGIVLMPDEVVADELASGRLHECQAWQPQVKQRIALHKKFAGYTKYTP